MENQNYKILLVDDEQDIIEFVGYNLRKENYDVYSAKDGKTGIQLARRVLPHLILLDVMMPEMDGIETCEQIRVIPELSNVIIAFLTARSEDYSQIAGFEAGADDYIAKPIKPRLLISRINALLKRSERSSISSVADNKNLISTGNLQIDLEKHLITMNGEKFMLPRKEFKLLQLLASKPEKVYTREDILQSVWSNASFVGDRTIDVHIRKLREKLGNDCIKTIKGIGYKYVDV